jgi:hypothetical protein
MGRSSLPLSMGSVHIEHQFENVAANSRTANLDFSWPRGEAAAKSSLRTIRWVSKGCATFWRACLS